MEMLENKTQLDFNYLAVVGNSGTGKTTFVKQLLKTLSWDQLFVVCPNRQYGDFIETGKAVYVTPGELKAALNVIGKRMLLTQKKAVLVIEDLSFTIERLAESLQISSNKAKKIIFLLLENLRKYDVKVIVVMHDIDADIVGKCDAKVFFQVPLTQYKAKVYSALFSLDMTEIKTLPQYQYVCKGRTETQRGTVTALESHVAIERDKSFMVKEMLGKCRSLVEKVLVLRLHLEMKNTEIANSLGGSVKLSVKLSHVNFRLMIDTTRMP